MSKTYGYVDESVLKNIADGVRKTAYTTKELTLEDMASLLPPPHTPRFTGNVDEAGLRYIGWDDDDINKLKLYVDWNSSEDELYKVPQSHKDLYDRCSKITVNGRTMLPYSEIEKWTKADFKLKYLPMIDFSERTNIQQVFANQYWLIAIPNINVEKVIYIGDAFAYCYNILFLPDFNETRGSLWHFATKCNKIINVNIKQIESSCNEAFAYMYALTTIPNITIKTTNITRMFVNCYSLETIPWFDTSNVTSMRDVFINCYNLRTIPLLDTSAVTDVGSMFHNCSSLYTIPKLNFSRVTTSYNMFYGCTNLTELPELDFSNTTNVSNMYRELVCLRTPLVVNFPKTSSYNGVCYAIRCKSIEWHIHSGITRMDGCFAYGICDEMHFSEDSVLTSITQSSYLPFNGGGNRINKACVNYTLVKEVFEMMLRGIPNYTADTYPMYFESGSTVTDDSNGTLTSMLNQCSNMKWAVFNLEILTE